MDIWILAIRIIFLSQTTTGILGNLLLIFDYLVRYHREYTLKPTDLILMHLIAANTLVVFSAGVPQTMAVWGLRQFLNDFACDLLLYIQGFARNVSIGTTCLLSVFQAMTLSPRKSCWNDNKVRASKYIKCSISLLWVFYMVIRFIFLVHNFIKMNSKNMKRSQDFGYCSIVGHDEISDSLYAALVMCPESVFAVLITWSIASMIVILYRHKRRVQYIRNYYGSRRNFPESRATQNILILLCTFLAFYTLSTNSRGYIALLYNQSWWLVYTSRLTSLCFPCFVPFVILRYYSFLSLFSMIWLRK
ncbi:vomeronasal type-1 receptor 4-like [Onychomys torridus]|uniref:vomeronasal type-1 receptor 4-like n=1 Tax=Onychomys torridus TaxID=38674 RepID=UPI00167FD2D3|nr:vomeronasal type-1 receptor 4-like [Onychomys torridus]